MTTKTYTTAANAKRAALTAIKKAGLADEQFVIAVTGEDGAFRATITIPSSVEDLGADQLELLESSDNYDLVYERHDAAELPKPTGGYIAERSQVAGACAMVHAIASNMPGAARKDVISECRRHGIAYGTARTQYQKWLSKQK